MSHEQERIMTKNDTYFYMIKENHTDYEEKFL